MFLKDIYIKLGLTAVAILFNSVAFGYPSSTKDLCFVSLMDRYLWSSKIMSLATQKSKSVNDRVITFKRIAAVMNGEAWEVSLIPHRVSQGMFRTYLGSTFEAPIMASGIKRCILEESADRQKSEFNSVQKTLLTVSCFALVPGDAIKCQNGVTRLYRESRSSKCVGLATNYATVWANRLGDKEFFKGLTFANKELITQINSKKLIVQNLQQALFKGMKSVNTYNSNEADDAAWDAVMMMANSGHDFSNHVGKLAELNSLDTITTMYNLSHAQNIIDFDEQKLTPTPFSFPPEVKGTCQTTKPYHFWMAAYQARSLIKAGFSAREAVTAVLTYAKAYHTHTGGTESSGGNPFRKSLAIIFQMPFDHPTVSVLRHDLVLNIIGAAYGAGMLKNKSINIADVMNRVFKERPKVGDLDYETEAIPKASNQLEAYTFWEKMFNPNGIYKIVMSSIK